MTELAAPPVDRKGVRVLAKRGLIGAAIEAADFDCRPGLTANALLQTFAEIHGEQLPDVLVAIDGEILTPGHPLLDVDLRDGQTVVLAPATGGELIVGVIVYVLVSAAVSLAVNYLVGVLHPRPKPPGLSQERDDEASPTYSSWGLETSYGPGLPIPWGFGRHAIGGQVIWSDVEANRASPSSVDDRLRIVLALCEGPIHRVGNLLPGSYDALGGFVGGASGGLIPSGIDINGNLLDASTPLPGVRVWIRPGTQDQAPLPAPFSGIATTETLNLPLDQGVQVFTIPEAKNLAMLRLVFVAPAGLYEQGPTGNLLQLGYSVTIRWRLPGSSGVGTYIHNGPVGGSFSWTLDPNGPHFGYHAATVTLTPAANGGFPSNLSGPVELLVGGGTGSAPTPSHVRSVLWRDVVTFTGHQLRYPGIALCGLELAAGVKWSGGRPNVRIVADLATVRVWDSVLGWSPECWDVPAAPFNFNTHAPGRNPAWCLLAFLRARYGLLNYYPEHKIDLPAFRRWAAYCDGDPDPATPWNEPRHTVDLIGDQPRPTWEWVLAFCAAGRASPCMVDGKLSIVYQYRDEHGDAGITVPARAPTQLLTSGMVEDVAVQWMPKANRPTALLFQFLDEANRYERDEEHVPDTDGTLDDPTAVDRDVYRPEPIQAWGVTRRSQLYREGRFRHRAARLVDRELTFTTGRWLLGGTIGTLFLFEWQGLRPFGEDVPRCMQVVGWDEPTLELAVDHHLVAPPSGSLYVIVRGPDGTPSAQVEIVSFVNDDDGAAVNPAPRALCTLASSVTVVPGATCVIGRQNKLVETYEIVGMTVNADGKIDVRAFNYEPAVHDDVTEAEYLGSSAGLDEELGELALDDVDELPPATLGVRLVAQNDGAHVLTWASPASKIGTPARVWIRELASTGDWQLLGETEAQQLPAPGLRPAIAYEVAVCLQNLRSEFVPPDLGDRATVTPEEFPAWSLPPLTNVRATKLDGFLLLEWDELSQRDLTYFEVRSGSSWAAGEVLARERAPRVYLPNPPAGSSLMLAARSRSGLYGDVVVITDPLWTPPNLAEVLLKNDLSPSPSGTHSATQWNATDLVLELAAGQLQGTYTSEEQTFTNQAPRFWQVRVDRQEIDDGTIDEALDFDVDSGESHWRTVDGRPASPALPGVDWQSTIDDLTQTIDELPGTLLVQGHVGEIGSHTLVLVESRFRVDGAWTEYRKHYDRVVLADRMQVRLTFHRTSTRYLARVRALTYAVYL